MLEYTVYCKFCAAENPIRVSESGPLKDQEIQCQVCDQHFRLYREEIILQRMKIQQEKLATHV